MRVRLTPRAVSDLEHILSYIDQENRMGALNVKRAIRKTIELIGQYPHVGRLSGEEQSRVVPVGRYPYLVYWQVENGEVWVLHVRDGRRRPWAGE